MAFVPACSGWMTKRLRFFGALVAGVLVAYSSLDDKTFVRHRLYHGRW
jgi:hypothetical protein